MKKAAVLLMAAVLVLPQCITAEEIDPQNVSATAVSEVISDSPGDILIDEISSGIPAEEDRTEDYTENNPESITDNNTESVIDNNTESYNDNTVDTVSVDPVKVEDAARSDDVSAVKAALSEASDSEESISDDPVPEDSIPIDEAHFPDEVFRAYIGEVLDPDQDGLLSPEEIQKTDYLTVCDMGIQSLDGIEYFSALDILECSNNGISSIDLTGNPNLYRIFIDNNGLEQFLVNENNKNLAVMDVSHNRLKELDLSALSCPEMMLDCSFNELVSLIVPSCMKSLNAEYNHLVCFDITGMDVTTAWTGTSSVWHYYRLQNNCLYVPRVFDLAELYQYGFDLNKVSDWYGGSLDGSVLTITGGNTVKYRYNIGQAAWGEDQYEIFSFVTDEYTLREDADGEWRVYSGDLFADDYNGLINYNGGEFFIANGVLCSDANGLNLYDDKWYFLSQGQVQRQWTGFSEYDNHWFYIEDGVLNESANGLYPYNDGFFLLAAGRLQDQYSGLWQNSYTSLPGAAFPEMDAWYFLAGGQLQKYSGVAMYDGDFFVVKDGRFQDNYNGEAEYDNHKFAVVNGRLAKTPIS